MPVKNPMTNGNYWHIRKNLPGSFDTFSHEKLTELILNNPDELIQALEKVEKQCQEVIHCLICDECKKSDWIDQKEEA